MLSRAFTLGLLLTLAACATQEPPAAASSTRAWSTEDGTTRSVMLTVSADGSAMLLARGPARSVPHWGELDYPEELAFGAVRKVGDRTFLVFNDESLRVVEVAERSPGHLAVWFRRSVDSEADIEAQLRALPVIARAPDLELTLVPERKPETRRQDPSVPATRFAI